jgi:hypothetical protein
MEQSVNDDLEKSPLSITTQTTSLHQREEHLSRETSLPFLENIGKQNIERPLPSLEQLEKHQN